MEKAIEVLIVDDSQIHLEGLKLILKPYDIQITGEANNIKEALGLLNGTVPDVAILDISLEKDMDGISLAEEIRKRHPEVKIIFLSHYKGTKYLMNALKTGASAYLAKDVSLKELVHAITSVKKGNGVYFGETIPLPHLLDIFGSEQNIQKNKPYDLTPREVEIIHYLAQGYSTKELAFKIGIEVNSIESHKERIKEKLNVKTVVQIVTTSIKKGIINLDT